ncbi:MAG TPA: hypothetical protein VG345_16510 [Bryobacteraceae bacterium]|jgi:hypothetical protein|nr:hypothetical protein [Bryobacteraceae bacterium]
MIAAWFVVIAVFVLAVLTMALLSIRYLKSEVALLGERCDLYEQEFHRLGRPINRITGRLQNQLLKKGA